MNKHFIMIGYGDVGRKIVQVLEDTGVSFVVIDKDEAKIKDKGFNYVAGDATDEEILRQAGVQDASTVIITMNKDEDIIFATLIARNTNPDCIIIARANISQSIDKIYRAGANYVVSLSIVTGQMLARIALGHEEEQTMIFQGLEIERYPVASGSPFVGKKISEVSIRSRTGCTIIGIEENGKTITDIDPSITIRDGMTLAIIGNYDQILKFQKLYQ